MPTENQSTDPLELFIRTNPTGLSEEALVKETTGFADPRTHADYLVFLAGYEAGKSFEQLKASKHLLVTHPDGTEWTVIHGDKHHQRALLANHLTIAQLYARADAADHDQLPGQPEVRPCKPVAYRWEQLGGKGYMYGDELPAVVFTPWQELYVAADAGEVERMRLEIEQLKFSLQMHDDASVQDDCVREENRTLRTTLVERDALLREQSGNLIVLAARLLQEPLRVLNSDLDSDKPITRIKVTDGVERAGNSLGDLALEVRHAADALSACAGQSTRTEPDNEIPGTSFQRLNALANQGE